METELNDPAFDAPGAPQKWLVMLWGLAIVVAIGTEFTRYNMSKKNEKKKDKTTEEEYNQIGQLKMDIRRANGNGSQLGLSNPRYEGDGTEWIVEKDEDGKVYKRMIGSDKKILLENDICHYSGLPSVKSYEDK